MADPEVAEALRVLRRHGIYLGDLFKIFPVGEVRYHEQYVVGPPIYVTTFCFFCNKEELSFGAFSGSSKLLAQYHQTQKEAHEKSWHEADCLYAQMQDMWNFPGHQKTLIINAYGEHSSIGFRKPRKN